MKVRRTSRCEMVIAVVRYPITGRTFLDCAVQAFPLSATLSLKIPASCARLVEIFCSLAGRKCVRGEVAVVRGCVFLEPRTFAS